MMGTVRMPFREEETEDHGFYTDKGGVPAPVFGYPVSPKENMRALYSGQPVQWMPRARAERCYVSLDILPDSVARSPSGGRDLFGVEWVYVPEAGGSMVRPGQPMLPDVTQWEQVLTFPDVASWDWSSCRLRNEPNMDPDRPVSLVLFNGLFERLIALMDFGNAAMALIDEETIRSVCALFDRLCSLYEDIIFRCKQNFDIDLITFHDDWGGQRAPLFSTETCRQMLIPWITRLAAFCHRHGLYFEQHSCGCVASFLPLMIDAGVDSWDGQDDANDKFDLIRRYGDRIHILVAPPPFPEGSDPEEMEQAAATLLCKVGQNALLSRNRGGPAAGPDSVPIESAAVL